MDTNMAKFILAVCMLTQLFSVAAIGVFDMHHIYSDEVSTTLASNNTPQKGTSEYYSALIERDRLRLSSSPGVTFGSGDVNQQINYLSYLYYANITIGTPPLSYLVGLDTGSSLTWLSCNCSLCPRIYITNSGMFVDFNIYNPSKSSTSSTVPCGGHSPLKSCDYNITYGDRSYTTGVYVADVLRLATHEVQPKRFDTKIIFGCSTQQTGKLLYDNGVNGILGLGPNAYGIDVPNTLEEEGIIGSSFSMCFSSDKYARLVFGDKGDQDQRETPLVPTPENTEGYAVLITKVAVNEDALDVNISILFDTGTSFTYLTEPAYSFVTKHFISQTKEPHSRYINNYGFEYCYDLRPNQTSRTPLNMTLKGGQIFHVLTPLFISFQKAQNRTQYCLAILKSVDVNVNVIGQNFMTGYELVFDRKKSILGWKKSDCKVDYNITTYPMDKPSYAIASTPTFVSLVMMVILVYCLGLHM